MAEPQVTQASAFVTENSPKLSELAGFGDQVNAAFVAAEDVAAQADVRLRQEIGQVTAVIDLIVGTLKKQVDALKLATNAARATPLGGCSRSASSCARTWRADGAADGRARAQDR